MQKHVNLVDLVKSFPTSLYLQKSASIQPRTSPIKIAHLAEKSEKGSVSNLSTKVNDAVHRTAEHDFSGDSGRVFRAHSPRPQQLSCLEVRKRADPRCRRGFAHAAVRPRRGKAATPGDPGRGACDSRRVGVLERLHAGPGEGMMLSSV